jgi:hypothetical protein
MDFRLTEAQALLVHTARDFFQQHCPTTLVRSSRRSTSVVFLRNSGVRSLPWAGPDCSSLPRWGGSDGPARTAGVARGVRGCGRAGGLLRSPVAGGGSWRERGAGRGQRVGARAKGLYFSYIPCPPPSQREGSVCQAYLI